MTTRAYRSTSQAMAEVVNAGAMVAFWLAAIGGWIANVAKIAGSVGEPLAGLFIFRCIGVLAAPVGAVLGYF